MVMKGQSNQSIHVLDSRTMENKKEIWVLCKIYVSELDND